MILPSGCAVTVLSTVMISVVVLVAPPGSSTVTVCVLANVVAKTVWTRVLGASVSETVTIGGAPVRVASPAPGPEISTVEPPMYEVRVANDGSSELSTLTWITVVKGSAVTIEERTDCVVTVDTAEG